MENRSKKSSMASLPRSQSSQRLKFKQLPQNSSEFNELNSKYELYRQGSPNIYNEDLQVLKVRNIKGQMGMVDLPAIDHILAQMSQTDKDKSINHRNYDLYPSLLKNPHTRYKDILSQKQEVKDFIIWFETQFQNIQTNQDSSVKKFQDKQILIAAGFTEITSQVAKISKHRAEILKMLWNREHSEVSAVIETLNGQGIKKEKTLLEQISSVHREYQDQIENLRKTSKELEEKYNQEKTFSRACVNDLRILRRRIKKLEYMSRRLGESNTTVRKENLHLMEENIKLLSNINDITQQEAVVLNYRKLQLHHQKQNIKKHNYKKLLELTQPEPEQSLTPIQDLEEKKNNLLEYFLERVKENPDEKTLIKDQYFIDEENDTNVIETYFKNVINRPSVQIELLNQPSKDHFTKDKGVNTDQEKTPQETFVLTLEKGIQAEVREHWRRNISSPRISELGEKQISERWIYHCMDEKEEKNLEQKSRMRIIQHRISRKNSLTLLQLQNMSEISNRILQKKSGFSHLAKKPITLINLNHPQSQSQIIEDAKEDNLEQSQSSVLNHNEDKSSDSSELTQKSQTILLDNIAENNDLTAINLRATSHMVRKSYNFKQMLEKVSQEYKQTSCQNLEPEKTVFIKLNGQQKQAIKQSQLDDLISKHLQKNTNGNPLTTPEKSLGKLLLSLFRNLWGKSNINLKFELLDMIKQSFGNIKSVMWKFLNVVSMIKKSQNTNPLLKIFSIMLKINEKYQLYNPINTSEIADIYFHLFVQLSVKTINDEGFSIWKACTTMDKVRTVDFMAVVEEFFSDKKRRYIEGKITELLAVSQQELRSKKITSFSSRKRIELVSDDHSILKLNPLILYIIEVYLIEKHLFYTSYSQLADFITTNEMIPVELFLWMIELMGFSQEKQIKIIEFVSPLKSQTPQSRSLSRFSQESTVYRSIKPDMLFRCCVKFDFPLMEQLSVSTYSQFKTLPIETQQKYYRMIGMQQWMQIKDILIERYQTISQSPIYMTAFTLVAEKLQNQIRKGASIYGDYRGEKIKRKEEVFSLFYKILIVEAHRNLLNQEESRSCWETVSRQ